MKEEKPFFSVVVPVYNKEPHIARSINSILNQTFTDFELIIVCDPSTDNSNAEVAKFTDPRIRVFHRDEPGPGGYAARNLGIKNAKADWIAFLDADDEWYPEHLEKMEEIIIIEDGFYFFGATFELIDKNSQARLLRKYKTNYKKINFSDYLTYSPFYTSTVVAGRELLLESGLFPAGEVKRGGDVDTWLRAIEKAGGYIMSSHIGARYYRDAENMVTMQNYYTEPEIENDSIKKLILKYENTDLSQKLMVKFNNQVIYAWNQNMHLNIKKNFELKSRLYFKAQPIKVGFYLVLSSLPVFILNPLHKLLYKLISIKRSLKS